jgi:hypothetical protein
MTLEERVRILEEQVQGLISVRVKDKMYTDADINGTRQSVANLTPFTMTKSAYYGENAKAFYGVPEGNTSVFFSKYNGSYTTSRVGSTLTVAFDTLTEPTDITISIN